MTGAAAILLLLAMSVPSTAPDAGCGELVVAQDELVKALEGQVAELKLAVQERQVQVAALEAVAAALSKQSEIFQLMYQAEAAAAAKDRKRAAWQERWQAVKWGGIGAAAGVLLMELAGDE